MITTKLYLDTRAVGENEPAPLKLCITKHRQSAYISLGIKITKEQWDAKRQSITNAPNKQLLTHYIKSKTLSIENAILELSSKGELTKLNATQIKNLINGFLNPEPSRENLFLNRYRKFMESRPAPRTREIYATTLKKIKDFDKDAESLSFENITKDWLTNMSIFLTEQGLTKNSRNIHFRNIRAVINDAIDNEITTHYPMRTFDINPEETEKRSLTIDELRTLFNYEVAKWQQKYLDFFKLTFFLIGINPVDLEDKTDEDIKNGRIIYKRHKTGRMYSIKIEPEAQEIINKYKGKNCLVNFMEHKKNYKDFISKTNKALKKIGPITLRKNPTKTKHNREYTYHIQYNPIFPHLSIYWARHTWATIAFAIGIPEEIIAEALGHSHGNRTTAIYIDKRVANIDAANRKVIDYVLYGRLP